MILEWFMILFGWLAALLFIGVAAYKIIRLVRLPMNLRWEVYPVPQEAEEKRVYGGSYMEEVDWARGRRTGGLIPQLLEIGTEVVALKRVREHNRYGIWPLSMAMHWGLYLYFAWLGLLVLDNLFSSPILSTVTTIVGLASFLLGLCGALTLVYKRATNPDLSLYTAPIDYFNLLFIATFFGLTLISWLAGLSFDSHREYIGSVLSFKPVLAPPLTLLAFFAFELFMIYMPFSKLIHYIAKYFTFHHGLWDDQFSTRGSAHEQKVIAQLNYPVRWSGPHIARDKTWLEQAKSAEGEAK